MAKIEDYKVQVGALDSKKVQSLSNYPSRDGVSAEALKKIFDWPEIFIKQYFNPLVDLLQNGALKSMGIEPYKDITSNNLMDFLKQLADKRVVFKTENANYIKVESDENTLYLMVSQNGVSWSRVGHDTKDVMLKSEFVTGNKVVKVSETSKDSEKLGGQLPSYYETKTDGNLTRAGIVELTGQLNRLSDSVSNKLGKTETAVDSNKLGGKPAVEYALKTDIEEAGAGDMLSSKYDSNKDGIVNKADVAITAESVHWNNVENRPTDLATNKTVETMVEPIGRRLSIFESKVNSLQENSGKLFDFDNIAEMKGYKKIVRVLNENRIIESIVTTNGNKQIAKRETQFFSNNTVIRVDITIYKDDGKTILKQIVSITTFKPDGDIEEVIS